MHLTPQEERDFLKYVSEALLTCRRENMRTLARLKALETMVRHFVPKDKREAWYKRLNKHTKTCLHDLLASLEEQNPSAAAQLDNREDWEINDES